MIGAAFDLPTIKILKASNLSDEKFEQTKINIVKDYIIHSVNQNLGWQDLDISSWLKFDNTETFSNAINSSIRVKFQKIIQEKLGNSAGYFDLIYKLNHFLARCARMLLINKKEANSAKKYIKEYLDILTVDNEQKWHTSIKSNEPVFEKDKNGNFIIVQEKDRYCNEYLTYKINPNIFTWERSNYCYDFAKENNLKIHGHTIIWHDAIPTKLAEELIQVKDNKKRKKMLYDFIKAYMLNYLKNAKEQNVEISYIDLFNEIADNDSSLIVDDFGNIINAERISAFKKVLGEEYYIDIIKIAKEVFPEKVKIIYNDYNEHDLAKRKKMIAIIEKIVKEEERLNTTLLDTIGLQAHLYGWENNPNLPSTSFDKTFEDFSKFGKEIYITELDCTIYDSSLACETISNKLMSDLIKSAKKYGVKNIQVWNISDSFNWKGTDYTCPILKDGSKQKFVKLLNEFSDKKRKTKYS